DVENGIVALVPLQSGRVENVLVHENETVSAQAPLVHLDDRHFRLRVEEAQAALAGATLHLVKVKERPARHQTLLAQQQATVEAASFRLEAARQILLRKRDQVKADIVKKEDVAVAENQVHELEALLKAENSKLSELKLHDPTIDVRLTEADVKQ